MILNKQLTPPTLCLLVIKGDGNRFKATQLTERVERHHVVELNLPISEKEQKRKKKRNPCVFTVPGNTTTANSKDQ
jgi:hypothetical protein